MKHNKASLQERDCNKYPTPQDEPMLEMSKRLGVRPGRPGESSYSYGQSDPFYMANPISDEEKLKEWEEIKSEWEAYEASSRQTSEEKTRKE